MTNAPVLLLTADGVRLSIAGEERHAVGSIERQDRHWWSSLSEACAGMQAIPVVLEAPYTYPLGLPHSPRSRRELAALVDRLAPIRNRHLHRTAPRRADDGGTMITIAHAAQLRALRAVFADNGVPPPLFLAPDGASTFDAAPAPADGIMRTTALVVFATILAIPLLSLIGAKVLIAGIAQQTGRLDGAQAVMDETRREVRQLAGVPTVAARVASVARRLPDTGAVVLLSGDGGTHVSITLDVIDPESMRQALRRAGTFGTFHEVSRVRTPEGYRIVYSGVPQ